MATGGAIAGIFHIGDTGDSFVIAEWHPAPDNVAQQLFELADEIEDWTEPLTETRAAFIHSTELHFEFQGDPYDKAWVPLNLDYKKRKTDAGFPEEILVREGTLKKAATSEEAWLIGEREIIFNGEVLPPYGFYHQEGSPGWHLVQKWAAGTLTKEEEKQFSQTGVGRGQNLPQRMFIGADEETIAEIEAIFIRFINNRTDEFFDSPIWEMGSNVLGTFPVIGMTKYGVPILKTPRGPRFGRKIH